MRIDVIGTDNGTDSLLNLIRKSPCATVIEFSIALKTSERTIKRRLRELKTNGIIERIGSDRKGEWKILSNKD